MERFLCSVGEVRGVVVLAGWNEGDELRVGWLE